MFPALEFQPALQAQHQSCLPPNPTALQNILQKTAAVRQTPVLSHILCASFDFSNEQGTLI